MPIESRYPEKGSCHLRAVLNHPLHLLVDPDHPTHPGPMGVSASHCNSLVDMVVFIIGAACGWFELLKSTIHRIVWLSPEPSIFFYLRQIFIA